MDNITTADDVLLADLRRIASEVDGVPESVLDAARAAILTRNLDGQLVALVADSGGDESPAQSSFETVRAGTAGGSRLLSFEGNGVQVDLEVTERADGLDLIGMFTGASTEDCALEFASGEERALDVDSLGRFIITGVPRGPMRARCRSESGGRVTTSWVTL